METIVTVPNSESTIQIIRVPVISCDGCPELMPFEGGQYCAKDMEIMPDDSLDIVTECFKLLPLP